MKGKARIGKMGLFCEMGSAEEKGWSSSSKNCQKSDLKRRKQEKWTTQGKKRESFLEKSPGIGCKMGKGKKKEHFTGQKMGAVPRKIARNRVQNGEGQEKMDYAGQKNGSSSPKKRPKSGSEWRKARKTEISGRKRWGGVEVKKWALLPILQCYEVAKWVQMNFSRIFFRRSLAGNGKMPYLCTRNREATLLQERVTL